jgi:hypothetical protein
MIQLNYIERYRRVILCGTTYGSRFLICITLKSINIIIDSELQNSAGGAENIGCHRSGKNHRIS